MTPLLWTLIAVQIAMGAFDTFYHHELTERLAWRASQRHELQLHSLRNMLYAFLFLVLGWLEVHGIFAVIVIAVLVSGNRDYADGFRRRGSEPQIAGERADQSHPARDQLRRHSGVVAADPVRLGVTADRCQAGLSGLAQHRRRGLGGRGWPFRPSRLCRVQTPGAAWQRACG